jgi:hypothetical protein
VAYGAAAGIGYATVMNIRLGLYDATALPIFTAINVFDQVAVSLCCGIIIGYGLAEVAFNRQPFPLLLAVTVAFAAFIVGMAIPLTAGLANAGISVLNPASAVTPILSLLFAAALLAVIAAIFSFLFNVAERQETEAVSEEVERLSA